MSLALISAAGAKLTSCFSAEYLFVFLPFFLLIYGVVPVPWKKNVLIAASCLFYCLISGKLIVYLLLTAALMHWFGIWLDRLQTQMKDRLSLAEKEERKAIKNNFAAKKRAVVTLAAVLQLGTLLTLKYTGFFLTNINTLLSALHSTAQFEIPSFLIPVGLSFFSLQAVSYLLDVYRGVILAESNPARLLLFLGFFPQIVEGPICRYGQTAEALWNAGPIRYENLTHGLTRIAWGVMKKIVVADRLDPLVKNVFTDYESFDGGVIALSAVLYTVQLYMDFSGAMDVVLGTAQIIGVELPENFKRPFFSKTISEFWTRWHITLGAWFRDYVFYPVTTAGPMKKLTTRARKKLGNHYGPLLAGGIALFCVWLGNGVWHGVGWHFIFFGLYHFALIYGGNLLSPLTKRVGTLLHIDPERFVFRCLRILRTAVLVVIGELFFRAYGLKAGLKMFQMIFMRFSFPALNAELLSKLGVDGQDLMIVGVAVGIVFAVSLMQEKGVNVRDALYQKPTVIRWSALYALILFIVIFGAYGNGYTPVDPLYAQY